MSAPRLKTPYERTETSEVTLHLENGKRRSIESRRFQVINGVEVESFRLLFRGRFFKTMRSSARIRFGPKAFNLSLRLSHLVVRPFVNLSRLIQCLGVGFETGLSKFHQRPRIFQNTSFGAGITR